ncbi:cobalamin B12-binding domain-containing protein [Bacillus sp. H-16]|uniref:cobalamin B12-binding domain-containing protein n=1 Tax=Alteribacter salitolerans TaxID=2912333 RepID=UPI00196487CB|nr:B12-binding domain-containing protein [Alteribacter salitolerans]MBM7094347.1 cobalamin B12-binding domain-containing protein [Alteribacter salitolerans]
MLIERETFVKAILAGDQGKALHTIKSLRKKHSRLELYMNVITPAMYEVGRLWEENEISVADEHLATGVCDFVLSQTEYDLVHTQHNDALPKAMFFSVQDEWHQLGIKMVSILFKEKGWNVRYLNANLPLDHAINNAKVWKPEVVGMSLALAHRLTDLPDYLEAFAKLPSKPKILIGGRIMSSYDFTEAVTPNTKVIKDLYQLDDWLEMTKRNRRDGFDAQSNTSSIH